ncbi:MAG: hypothetical protein A2277_04545 [Desulfobacterales bacterium RIFOXYA12_FULL_46_15]|nr:MAG: hypothetical protein A2277_04545 [Desulfobacterales bacterium RIFOXYA12_FULL_46_15]
MLFSRHRNLKLTALIMDIVLILCLTAVFAGIYVEFGNILFLQKEKEHQRLIQNMAAMIDDFITREIRQVKLVMPFVDNFSDEDGTGNPWKDIPFLQSFFKTDTRLMVQHIYFSNNHTESARNIDLSKSRPAASIIRAQERQTDILMPIHTSLITGKDCIGFAFPFRSDIFVAELDINGIFDLINRTELLDLYREAVILLLKPDSGEILFRSSRDKYPFGEFSPQGQKIRLENKDYYHAEKILTELNIQLVVLTPERYYLENFDPIKRYLIFLMIIIWGFYIFRGIWTNKSFYIPLSDFLISIKADPMADVSIGSAYLEWMSFEKIYNNALGEIKKVSNDLRLSEEKYRTLVNLAPDGICITSFKGDILFFNDTFKKMFRHPEQDLKNKQIQDLYLYPETDRPRLLDRLLYSGIVKNYDLVLVDASGSKVYTSSSHAIISYEGQKCIETIVSDITTEKEREKEILYLKTYLDNIINSMPSMLITIDPEGRVTQWNTAAIKAVKKNAGDIIGQKLWDISPYFAKYEGEINMIFETRRPKIFHRELLSNGEDRYFNVTLFPLISNGIEGIALRADDITEIDKREQQLRQSQKMELVGTLAGGLAHDFNNVLTGIIGTVSLMQFEIQNDGTIQTDELVKYLATMEKTGQRAADIIRRLLTLSRRQAPLFRIINLNTAVRNVMDICKNSFDKSIELNPVPMEETAPANADQSQIEQVLLNLFMNACHAMTIMKEKKDPWGGKLTVSMEKRVVGDIFCNTHPEAEKGEYWMLTVADTGVGMEASEIEKIFHPFFTTKGPDQGTGLGMTMVHTILMQHQGFIDIFSRKGIGTTVNVYLPVAGEMAVQKDGCEKSDIIKGSGLILVVDDEEMVRMTAGRMLEKCGYDVISAEDGEEGVRVFKENQDQIRAVVLDMVMPKMSGKDAFIRMAEIDPNVKVILVSGFRQDERVREVLELGVKKFIQKPYTMEKLSRTVNDVL